MVLSAPWRRWKLGCLVAADEFCTKTPEDYSSLSLLQKAMEDGIFFFFFQRCLRLDGVFFLPRRSGDRLVLKWWMIALRNCRLFSVSVMGGGRRAERSGAAFWEGGSVPGTSVWYSLRGVARPRRLCCCCSTVSADGSLGRQINAVICRRCSPAVRSAAGGLPGQSRGGEAVKARRPLLFPAG